jgi:UDP-N-acetylglucosamine 2-epimerase (non-hydrolysing)
MGYKTQQILNETNLTLNENIKVIEPIGYLEFMYLLQNSQYVATDSGTVVEEACILGIPSIQMRYSTERPEVYDVKASIKFDPTLENEAVDKILDGVSNMINSSWINPFGDGNSSEIIVRDLIQLCEENSFSRHKPSDYSFDISNSFKG